MEIRKNTYIDASRAREAGITEEMIRDKIGGFDSWYYSDNVWYIDGCEDWCSHSSAITYYEREYPYETDVTDEFIEWLKPSKKEFDVYSKWHLNDSDIDIKNVLDWLSLNTGIQWQSGHTPTERFYPNEALDHKTNTSAALTAGVSSEPSTPEALAFFKEKLSIKEDIKTISYEDVQENFLDRGELGGKLWGSLDVARLKEAGLGVSVYCNNEFDEKYLQIWTSSNPRYSTTINERDLTDAFIKKYGTTTKEGFDVLKLDYSQLELKVTQALAKPFEITSDFRQQPKQKHKAYEKLFK